jgi:hypothetical protein
MVVPLRKRFFFEKKEQKTSNLNAWAQLSDQPQGWRRRQSQ